MATSERSCFLLFDGHALVHRAFHAVPPLTIAKTGEPVGAVFGVTSMLLKSIADYNPTHIVFSFDLPKPTFRHTEYADYKIHRASTPDDMRPQFARVKEVIRAFGIPIFEMEGFEADDILGTLSREAGALGLNCLIITGDSDTFQLVDQHVNVLTTRKGMTDTVLYDVEAIRTRYGLEPGQIPDLKALQGDTSDNIKGVPGVGEKTATKLLQQFQSVEGLIDHLAEITPPRIREALTTNVEQMKFSKWLATIRRDAPIEFDAATCRFGGYDRDQVVELFRLLDFRTLLGRLPGASRPATAGRGEMQLAMFGAATGEKTEEAASNDVFGVPMSIVTDEAELDRVAGILQAADSIVFDTETTDKDATRAGLVGIGVMGLPHREVFYIPVGHRAGMTMQLVDSGKTAAAVLVQPENSVTQLPLQLVLDKLRPAFQDPGKPKVAHNGKYDIIVLAEHGLETKGFKFDTMVAAYLLNERTIGLKDLAFSRLGLEMTPIADLIGRGSKQLSMAEVAIEKVAPYCSADVVCTEKLRELLDPELDEHTLRPLFDDIEMPLVPVLAGMERCGITIDIDLLRGLSHEIGEKMLEIERDIYNCVGHKFNINSTSQLGVILFEELKLPSAKRTKTGYSTDASVLEELRGQHEIVDLVLEYRQLSKLKSTYVDSLPTLINPKTGRVHTNYNQTVARSGRLSSQDPNLQNIPVRTPLGRRIRQAFVPGKPGQVLLSADYSQIELRILAHISRDPRLLEAFMADEDVHSATASLMFKVPLDEVTSDQRRVAKTTNFGIVYGISEFGLAERTDLSRKEAGEFIRNYYETFPGIREYIEKTKSEARAGKVQTLLGRIQLFAERDINSSNPNHRAALERTAINMPIQGSNADIIKMAMIRLHDELDKRGMECAMLLQVHDELVFEVAEKDLTELCKLVKDIMENTYHLVVPVRVDLKVGKNWNEMEPVRV